MHMLIPIIMLASFMPVHTAPPEYEGYRLVFADEFEQDGSPTAANWIYEEGFVRNRELQYYSKDNVRCENGILIIEARREVVPNESFDPMAPQDDWKKSRSQASYTSGSIKTKGLHSFKYGRFEMRGRIDTRMGLWPAFWTVGSGSKENPARRWPKNGEIDIMEYFRGILLANAAWGTAKDGVAKWDDAKHPIADIAAQSKYKTPQSWSEAFHTWRMDWDEYFIRIYVDDMLLNEIELSKTVNESEDGANPLREPHHMILNLAIGGTSGGDPAETSFPARFEVDWVRVYEATEPPNAPRLSEGMSSRRLKIDGRNRAWHVYVPPTVSDPASVVLVLHGAGMNGKMAMSFTGMNEKADREGFIAVYPDGTGAGSFLTWNSGGRGKRYDDRVNDVRFISAIIDDLKSCSSIDPSRIYATGISNGGMMCYRLATELSDRIAAIAPVAGTLTLREPKPVRRVPVMHFHGTQDTFVPWGGPAEQTPAFISFRSVEDTLRTWAVLNDCDTQPLIEEMPDSSVDGTTVRRWSYPTRPGGATTVLYEIIGGGHTWPGIEAPVGFIGKSTKDINANDVMWEFFRKLQLPNQ